MCAHLDVLVPQEYESSPNMGAYLEIPVPQDERSKCAHTWMSW
jgi:hypothetical protein